jgi:hypothetical protein
VAPGVPSAAPEPIGEVFFPRAGKIALAAMPGAPIVEILFFLHVASHHAAVICAGHQTTECNLSFRILGPVASGEDRLHLIEKDRIQK